MWLANFVFAPKIVDKNLFLYAIWSQANGENGYLVLNFKELVEDKSTWCCGKDIYMMLWIDM